MITRNRRKLENQSMARFSTYHQPPVPKQLLALQRVERVAADLELPNSSHIRPLRSGDPSQNRCGFVSLDRSCDDPENVRKPTPVTYMEYGRCTKCPKFNQMSATKLTCREIAVREEKSPSRVIGATLLSVKPTLKRVLYTRSARTISFRSVTSWHMKPSQCICCSCPS